MSQFLENRVMMENRAHEICVQRVAHWVAMARKARREAFQMRAKGYDNMAKILRWDASGYMHKARHFKTNALIYTTSVQRTREFLAAGPQCVEIF